MCVIKKHGCLLSYCSKITAEWLSTAIHILRKMPRKSDESSVKCYGYVFVIAGRSSGSIEEVMFNARQSKTNNLAQFHTEMTVLSRAFRTEHQYGLFKQRSERPPKSNIVSYCMIMTQLVL